MENKENIENDKQPTKKEKRNYQKDNYNLMIKLFILSMIVFASLYFIHNFFISCKLDKAIKRYSSPLENIIITKEEFYTNVIITEIESNKFITNNIILKSSSIEDLQNTFAEAIDSHTKNLQISISEIVKSSSDTLNFWLAFISIVMIVFSFAGAFVNNNILNKAKEQLKNVEKESKRSIKKIELATRELIEKNDKNIKINGLFNLAYQLGNKEDYISAIEYYKEILVIDPENYTAYYGMGLYKFYLDEFEKSIEYFDKAIEYNKKYLDAYFNRGVSYDRIKKYQKSINDYMEVLRIKPDHAKASGNIAICKTNIAEKEIEKKNFKDAYELLNEGLKYINKAIKINTGNEETYSKRIVKRKLNNNIYVDRYIARIRIKIYMYFIEMKDKNINKANIYIKDINDDFNKMIELYNNTAYTYDKIGSIKTLLSEIESKLKNEDKSKEILKEAIKDFDKAIELDNNFSEAYNTRGVIKVELQQYEEAIKDYDKSIELNNNDPLVYFYRGTAKLNLQQYEEAIKDYDKAIELNNNDPLVYFYRGTAKFNLQQYEEAIKDFCECIEIYKNDMHAYNQIGFCKIKLANIELKNNNISKAKELLNESIEYCSKGIKIVNYNAEIYDTRGYAKTKLANIERYNGNIKKAVKIYNDCLKDFYKVEELEKEIPETFNSIGYIKNILANIQKESISKEEYKHLKDEALIYFEKAYKITNDKLKLKIEKYLIKLAKENDSVGIEFCTKNNIDYSE